MKTNEERLAELLLDWEEATERGEPTDAAALCRDCPELQAELERLISILQKARWMDGRLDSETDTSTPSSATVADYPQPELLMGRYQLLELLGEGGYSRVYKAFDRELHRLVAVKFPKNMLASDGLLREARRVVQLRHPGIVPVIDLGREGERVFIVSELVSSGTLEQRLLQPVSREEALQWTAELAAALHYAHSRRVIHLDVKPANILLDDHQHAMLTDFGIAVSPQPHDTLRQSKGTLRYMSPEQLARQPLDHRSDIYSLGVVLHELLTGRLPYNATQTVDLANAIAAGDRELVVESKSLRNIVRKATSLQAAERFESAEDFAQAIRAEQAGSSLFSRRVFLGGSIAGAALCSGLFVYRRWNAAGEPARWLAMVSAAPAEKQVQLVIERLQKLNPRFNGIAESKIVDGVVEEWSMTTDQITDISPLRGLTRLKKLAIYGTSLTTSEGSKSHGSLRDLTPLQGLQLENLVICFNPQLTDLGSLRGMPLKVLNTAYTNVSDLSPLSSLPLEELRAGAAPISDATPIESCPLRVLTLDRTRIRRLPDLRTRPLETLISQFTPLDSLEGIEGTPLRHLECHETEVSDLTPIKSLKKLEGMTIYKTKVTDLSPLVESGGMQILYCDYVPERDREIIARIPRLEMVNDRLLSELLKAAH